MNEWIKLKKQQKTYFAKCKKHCSFSSKFCQNSHHADHTRTFFANSKSNSNLEIYFSTLWRICQFLKKHYHYLKPKTLIIGEEFRWPFLYMPWIWSLFMARLCHECSGNKKKTIEKENSSFGFSHQSKSWNLKLMIIWNSIWVILATQTKTRLLAGEKLFMTHQYGWSHRLEDRLNN